MKNRFFVVAIIATLFGASAAQASDATTVAGMVVGGSIIKSLVGGGHRCSRGYAIDRFGHCTPPQRPAYYGVPVPLAPAVYDRRVETAPAAPAYDDHGCSPGQKYITELDKCLFTERNVAEISKVMPADTQNDPQCKDHPAGYRYDTQVTGPNGEDGTAHHVCGARHWR
jgi:hypothetical protein